MVGISREQATSAPLQTLRVDDVVVQARHVDIHEGAKDMVHDLRPEKSRAFKTHLRQRLHAGCPYLRMPVHLSANQTSRICPGTLPPRSTGSTTSYRPQALCCREEGKHALQTQPWQWRGLCARKRALCHCTSYPLEQVSFVLAARHVEILFYAHALVPKQQLHGAGQMFITPTCFHIRQLACPKSTASIITKLNTPRTSSFCCWAVTS
jgi:hypothetical protein